MLFSLFFPNWVIDEFNPVNYAINMCNRNINISGTRSFIIHIGGMNLKTKEQNNLVNCNKTTKIADKHNNFIWPNINTLCLQNLSLLFFFFCWERLTLILRERRNWFKHQYCPIPQWIQDRRALLFDIKNSVHIHDTFIKCIFNNHKFV